MGETMKSPKGVKSGIPERVSISCHTCTWHPSRLTKWKPLNLIKLNSIEENDGDYCMIESWFCCTSRFSLLSVSPYLFNGGRYISV